MSLETQIAALVEAANSLTNAVSGKMAEIDQAVDDAVTGIPLEIRKQMDRTVYIDQTNGDDNNDGSSNSPLKSVGRAAQLTPSGGSLNLLLLEDYVFAVRERAEFTNIQVRIARAGPDNKRLKFSGFIDLNNQYHCNNFYAYRNCAFQFFGVDIELPDMPLGANVDTRTTQNSSIIGSNSIGDVAAPLSIRLAGCNIVVPDPANNLFNLTPGFGIVILSVAQTTAPSEWIDNMGVLYAMSSDPALYTQTKVIHDSNVLIPSSVRS